jgi:aquaporin Z
MTEVRVVKKYSAELIGTLALVLIGCGSAVIAGNFIGFYGIAFAFGLTVLAMVYAIGNISGCHINPAITLAMLVAGKIKGKDAVFYIIAQCIGGIIGAGILWAIASGNPDFSLAKTGLGQNGFGIHSPAGYSLAACFIAEVVLTALFLFVIFGSTHERAPKGFAGIAIGFTLVLIHLVGIPITGTSVNPARSLGPAVFVGGDALTQIWLFIVAPIIGGIIAAIIWKYGFESRLASRSGAAEAIE